MWQRIAHSSRAVRWWGGGVQIVFILPILVEILVPFLAKSLLRQVLQRISFWPELGDI